MLAGFCQQSMALGRVEDLLHQQEVDQQSLLLVPPGSHVCDVTLVSRGSYLLAVE